MSTPQPESAERRKPTLKERQRQVREDAILDAAEELLLAKGLGAMTLEELSVEVGISKPTLYQHFRSKEEVIASLSTRCIRDASQKLRSFAAQQTPGRALRSLIEWFVEESANNDCGPVTDLCIAVSQIAQGPMRDAERAFREEIQKLVEAAQREGSVRSNVPAVFVSQTLLSISKDYSYHEMLAEGRTDVPTMQRAVVRMLLGDDSAE